MAKLWKRNAVIAVVLLFVCAAVYLNWSYNQMEAGLEAGGKTYGEATLVGNSEDGETEDGEGAQVPEAANNSDYFDSARLTRQQARDRSLAMLQEAAGSEESGQETRDEANQSIQTMAVFTNKEAAIETLVTAKGYSDCIAYINNDSISVVVAQPEAGLSDTDVAKVMDIVLSETDFSPEQIKIVGAQ